MVLLKAARALPLGLGFDSDVGRLFNILAIPLVREEMPFDFLPAREKSLCEILLSYPSNTEL